MKPPHYTAHQTPDGKWRFTTPATAYSGFYTESRCQAFADTTRDDDLDTARNNCGPFAAKLRAHFFPTKNPRPLA